MGRMRGSAVLLIAAVSMMMFLAGCETTKHAETMSAEELRALKQASRQVSVIPEGTEKGTGSLSVAKSERMVPLIAGLDPEEPASPTFGNGGGVIADTTGASADLGSRNYEDEQFARALTPLDESNSDVRSSGADRGSSGADRGSSGADRGSSGADRVGSGSDSTDGATDEEVVSIPALTDVEESIESLRKNDLREGGMNEVGIELGHVYFGFDQFLIQESGVRTLQVNAQLLNTKYQNSGVLVAGHCDERGTSDYNLVLGERRAKAVRDYLVDLGVLASRIRIVSYGEERPSCTESRESCWKQNRRAHFVLQ